MAQLEPRKSFGDWSHVNFEDIEDNSSTFVSIWNVLVDATEAFRSILVRIMFGLHLALVIYALQTFICIEGVWILMSLWSLICLEYLVSLRFDYSLAWLQPCVLVHLLVICPLIWCMEIGLHDHEWFSRTFDFVPNCTNGSTQLQDFFTGLMPTHSLAVQFLVRSSEQVLLLVLISSRWILPVRHAKHRYRISQLLLMQIGRAADLSDIVDLFDVRPSAQNAAKQGAVIASLSNGTFIMMLLMWQISLFQFSIDFTARKKAKKTNYESFDSFRDLVDYCMQTEIWALLLSLLLQDCPFFALRLYLFAGLKIFEEDIVFFMFNNAFMIMLSIYRIYNIFEDRHSSAIEEALRDATDMFRLNPKQRLVQRFRFRSTRVMRRRSAGSTDSRENAGKSMEEKAQAAAKRRFEPMSDEAECSNVRSGGKPYTLQLPATTSFVDEAPIIAETYVPQSQMQKRKHSFNN